MVHSNMEFSIQHENTRVGRCASCRFSVGSDLVGVSGLVCAKWNKSEAYSPVKPHWKCDEYEYEPGAAS